MIRYFEISAFADAKISLVPEKRIPGVGACKQFSFRSCCDLSIRLSLCAQLPGDPYVFAQNQIRFPFADYARHAITLFADSHLDGDIATWRNARRKALTDK